ncbi:hypothetical protein [Natronorubrum sp. FCH18a]|uniref:hypothetical protein n=1 Tax=Natronorubrum sp. FCH18a TaxID=3447018 RepID=UPI003F51194D
MNRGAAVVVALLVVTSAVGMAMGASAGVPTSTADAEPSVNSQAESEAYAGTHVAFDVEGDAITDYQVGGDETFSSVAVQSQNEADAGAGLGADVDVETMTALEGAGLSMAAQSETSAQVEAESGATLSAHDTERVTLVVETGDDGQFVRAELAGDATASAEGDAVRVDTDAHEGVFLVVGDGEVTVTDDGDVAAELEAGATLAYRSYADGDRDESAEYEESLIADGSAAVEVYAEERDGETVSDAVTYGEETAVEVSQESRNQVEVTVDRTVHEGTIVMTTVSEDAVGAADDLEVRVDGEAATEASSESELESALGGDESRYMVAQHAEASAEATVYIAINHFSERTATIDGSGEAADDSDTDDADDGGDTADDGDDADDAADTDGSDADDDTVAGDSVPGFGVGAALVAMLTAVAARVSQ